MSDMFDQATDKEMADRELCIRQARDATQMIPMLGCLDCGARVADDKSCKYRGECLADWQHEQDSKQRNIKVL